MNQQDARHLAVTLTDRGLDNLVCAIAREKRLRRREDRIRRRDEAKRLMRRPHPRA